MKKISLYLCISILFAACNNEEEIEPNLYLHLEESEVIVVHATGGEYKYLSPPTPTGKLKQPPNG